LKRDLTTIHLWHGVVQNDDIDRMGGEEFEASSSVGCGENPVSSVLQKTPTHTESNDIIINA